jgi:cyanophycinase
MAPVPTASVTSFVAVKELGAFTVTVVDADGMQYSSMAQADGDAPVCMLGMQVHLLTAGATYNLETRKASAGTLSPVKE